MKSLRVTRENTNGYVIVIKLKKVNLYAEISHQKIRINIRIETAAICHYDVVFKAVVKEYLLSIQLKFCLIERLQSSC